VLPVQCARLLPGALKNPIPDLQGTLRAVSSYPKPDREFFRNLPQTNPGNLRGSIAARTAIRQNPGWTSLRSGITRKISRTGSIRTPAETLSVRP
jgi:hypothetical protein